MKKYLLLLILPLTIVSCKEEIEKSLKPKTSSELVNKYSKSSIGAKMVGGTISCYLNDTLEFECADIIERISGDLFMVLANDVTRKKIPFYSTSTNGSSWTTPQQLNIPNPHNWQFHHVNVLEAYNKIFIVLHRITSREGGIPAITSSSDNGVTWTVPKLMLCEPEEEILILSSRNMTKTKTGRLIIPVASGQLTFAVSVLKSDDQGNTWIKGQWQGNGVSGGFAEPTIAQLKDGRLIMLIRTRLGTIYKSYSTDDGDTWSSPESTSMISPSTAHTLRVTKEGYLMVVFTNRVQTNEGYPRDNLTSAVSFNNGITWEQYTSIIDNMPIVMEPSLTLFGNNKVLITYLKDDPNVPNDELIVTESYDKSDLLNGQIITEEWSSLANWNYSSNGVTEINKQLHLSDASNSTTLAYMNTTFSNNYTLEVRAKINDFYGSFSNTDLYNTTLGIKVGDGSYRFMMRLESDGIYVIDNSGTWVKKIFANYINTINDWHIWKVLVNNGLATIYMDDNLAVPTFNLEATNNSVGRIEHWTRSNATATDCYVDYTRLKDISNSNLINNNWSSLAPTNTSGFGTKEIISIGNDLHLGNSNSTLTFIDKNINRIIPSNYTLEFKAKINSFNGSTNDMWSTTLGTKVGDGNYRFMMRLEEDGIYVIDNSSYWTKKTCTNFVNTKKDWHVWKVIVNNGSAEIYMDAVLVVPTFNLEATNYDSGKVGHWTTSTDNLTDFYVDYAYLSDN